MPRSPGIMSRDWSQAVPKPRRDGTNDWGRVLTVGPNPSGLTALEICAGGGGQAVGLEMAGFGHAAAIEIDSHACNTLRLNRPDWNVIEADVHAVSGRAYKGIDLLAGGVPCPPFSIAGKQLGEDDERDLFPVALRLVKETNPAGVMLENVRGLAGKRFDAYRESIKNRLEEMGYTVFWEVLNASDYGVPQLRPRFILVALKEPFAKRFEWPSAHKGRVTVGEALVDLMGQNGWSGASQWAQGANAIAPTLVGGSKKHGGADLGPTRAKRQWAELGVDGMGVADAPPDECFPAAGAPKLTVRMAARIQGFPDWWQFAGRKTAAYRQVGNAFPPPVAASVGLAIRAAILGQRIEPLLQDAMLVG